MENTCIKCNCGMQKALLNTNAAFCMQTTRKDVEPKLCNVDVFVCPECGYIDFYAENPTIFTQASDVLDYTDKNNLER